MLCMQASANGLSRVIGYLEVIDHTGGGHTTGKGANTPPAKAAGFG
jgi:hypothetical protein